MAEEDSILLRLGMDNSGFANGLRSSLGGLKEFGQKTHEQFQDLGLAGRGFHKVLEQISDISPLLATGLKAAFNPTVVALGLIVSGAVKAVDAFKQWNEQLDEMAKNNAKPIFGTDKLHSLNRELSKLKEEQAEFQQGRVAKPGEGLDSEHLLQRIRLAETELKLAEKERSGLLSHRARFTPELLAAREEAVKQAQAAFEKAGARKGYLGFHGSTAQESLDELERAMSDTSRADIGQLREAYENLSNYAKALDSAKRQLQHVKDGLESVNDRLEVNATRTKRAEETLTSYDSAYSRLKPTTPGPSSGPLRLDPAHELSISLSSRQAGGPNDAAANTARLAAAMQRLVDMAEGQGGGVAIKNPGNAQ